MRKIYGLLIVVMLIALLFISCNNSSPINEDQLASLEFDQTEVTKALNVTVVGDYGVNDLYWFFTAVKTDAGPQTGITSKNYAGDEAIKNNTHIMGDALPVCADDKDSSVSGAPGLNGYVVSPFSVGNWTFGLYAYTKADRTAEGCQLVFSTSKFKSASVSPSMITKVKVEVDPVSSDNGSGKLVIKEITAGEGASVNGMFFQCKVDGITKVLKGGDGPVAPIADDPPAPTPVPGEDGEKASAPVYGNWNTISGFENNTVKFEDAPAGNYKVAVRIVYGSGDNEMEIEESIAVTVYNGFTTTVSGTIDNLTGGVEFDDPDAPVTAKYHVIYNANMATDGTAPVDNTVYKTGDEATVLGAGTLVKKGYTFSGWNTKANGTGTSYAGDGTAKFNIGSADVTLYAIWVKALKVTYDANGATGGTVPVDSNEFKTGEKATVLGAGALVKTGYSFNGWNTAANGTGDDYEENDKITIASADVILYARWKKAPIAEDPEPTKVAGEYHVVYRANGATSGSVPVDDTTYTEMVDSFTVKGNIGNLEREGCTFAGWSLYKDVSGAKGCFSIGDDYSMMGQYYRGNVNENNNFVLYAVWEYILTFDLNLTDGMKAAPGWLQYIEDKNNARNNGVTYSIKTLDDLGKWYFAERGTVDGGMELRTNYLMLDFKYNVVDELSGTSSPSPYYNYEFECWNTKKDGTGIDYSLGELLGYKDYSEREAFTTNTTLYAKWVLKTDV